MSSWFCVSLPAYVDTFLSTGVAICGAFTFVTCAALAIGQSNGKKILAYSTISNLGLIICCAGINTPLALTGAVLLIVFHAVSKSLLFLCVGTIEQAIGSRDIEDMRGLYAKYPRTALITIIGILTMLLPPFGVLMGKWMAIEAGADTNIFVVTMLALGSALTVVYWARWGGSLMSTREEGATPESQAMLTRLPLMLLCGGCSGPVCGFSVDLQFHAGSLARLCSVLRELRFPELAHRFFCRGAAVHCFGTGCPFCCQGRVRIPQGQGHASLSGGCECLC